MSGVRLPIPAPQLIVLSQQKEVFMETQELKRIFRELREFIPPALHVARVAKKLTKEEFCAKLKSTPCDYIDIEFLSSLEKEYAIVSFEEFEIFCKTLDFSVPKILNVAKGLYKRSGRSEVENAQEVVTEIEYWIWKHEQDERGKEN